MPALQLDADRAVLNISMPRSLANRLSKLAVERGETRSNLIRRAVEAAYFPAGTPHDAGTASGEPCPPERAGV